jgi:hypothetical protein
MDIIIGIIYFLIVVIGIKYIPFFRQIEGLTYRMLVVFFILKVLAGTLLIFIYTFYYEKETADFYKYFADGRVMYEAIKINPVDYLRMVSGVGSNSPHLEVYYSEMLYWYRPWDSPIYNDSRLIIRFNALLYLISFGSVHVHNIFANLISLSGLVMFYKFFHKYTSIEKIHWLPWGVFLFPSVLFWGSGILKESFLILGIGSWLYFIDKLITSDKFNLKLVVYIMITAFLLIMLKPYNLLFLIPCQLAFYLSFSKGVVPKQFIYAAVIIIWTLLGVSVGYFFPQFDALEIVARKQNNFIDFSIFIDAGSLLHTRYLKPELWDMLAFFPKGLWYVLTRPHILESYSLVVLMAAIENLFIIAMLIFLFIRFDRSGSDLAIVWLSVWYFVLLMGFVGLVTPLHGAFVRYKILALPFIWVAFINLTRLPDASWLNIRIFKWLLMDK